MRRSPVNTRWLIPFALLIAICVAAIFYVPVLGQKLLTTAYHTGLAASYYPLANLFRDVIFTVSFWVVILLTLALQWLIPAKPNQKIFSVSFGQDVIWFFYETVLHALIIVTYVQLLVRLFYKFLPGLRITSLMATPAWVRFILAALLLDFLYWAQHYINHKVPMLWQLHAVHHSQKELNFFTDYRYHVLEYVVRHTFLVIPFLILQVDPPAIAAFAIFQRWYSRLYHGNIRTNLGPLRYILVTPQSHRIHHSIEPGHRDTNYGSLLSIWDWMFGTQCKASNVYPDTGIDDEAFPHEERSGLKDLFITPLRQMIYPLKVISDRVGATKTFSPLPSAAPARQKRFELEFGDPIDEVSPE